jgi:hypothetical protein
MDVQAFILHGIRWFISKLLLSLLFDLVAAALGITMLMQFLKKFWQEKFTDKKKIRNTYIFGILGLSLCLLTLKAAFAPPSASGGFQANILWAGQIYAPTNASPVITNGTISGINDSHIQYAPGMDMMFVIRIVNTGPASSLWNWKSSIRLPGGSKIGGVIPSITGVSTTVVPTVAGPFLPTFENNMLQLLSLHSLGSGEPAEGWLLVHYNGLNTPQDGTLFKISFDDVFGNETRIEHTWHTNQ